MTGEGDRLELKGRSIRIVLLPALFLAAAALLLNLYGYPFATSLPVTEVSGPAEAAGRVRVLAAWLLLAVLGLGSAGYFWWRLRDFHLETVRRLLIWYAVLAATGIFFSANGKLEAHRYVGEDFVCQSFQKLERLKETLPEQKVSGGQGGARAEAPPASEKEKAPAAPKAAPKTQIVEEASWKTETKPCPGSRLHGWMSGLNALSRYMLPLITPALLLGMITALATGGSASFEQRTERLNTYLQLSAAVLVAGLLLLSALLRWPGFLLVKDDRIAFDAHVAALLLYWGVVYSLYIALTYLPVATLLKRERPVRSKDVAAAAPDRDGAEGKPAADPLLSPITMLKNAAVIFAPALAGLLAGVMEV